MDEKGMTLVELIIAAALTSVLAAAAVMVFNTVLLSWSAQTQRAGTDTQLGRAVEVMVRDLRQATQVQSAAGRDEVRYTLDGVNFYIYYLYHASDSYVPPPAFTQSSYQLRRAVLAGGIGGTFTYGAGTLVVSEVLPPPTSDLSLSGNLLTVDLSAGSDDETLRIRTQVRPRNL